MDNPVQRETWAILERVSPGKRTNAICEAICGYYKRKILADDLRTILREELRSVSIQTTEAKPEKPLENDDAVYDFIRALQEGKIDGL